MFKGDQFKTKVGLKDAFLLKTLLGNSKNGSILVPVKGPNQERSDSFLMNSIGSKSRLKVVGVGPPASVSIRLTVDVSVKDVPEWMDLGSEDQLASLEQTIEDYLENEIQTFVSLCKANRVDPVGFGDLIRSRSHRWDAREFEEHYGALKTTVSVKATIVQTGAGQ
ncbi:Ger(x)C family spore germination C-terminal domain-containing protein [Paenibacillus sp. GYB003]